MAHQAQLLWSVFVVLMFFHMRLSCIDAQQVPCYFIFGDSFADNGNDNGPDAHADYLPYGVDFPGGPNGRFSNGKTMVDVIAEKIGFKDHIPAFKKVGDGSDVLKGVNYAFARAIVRAGDSGNQLDAISMSQQVKNHEKIVQKIHTILGDDNKAKDHLQQCLYTVGIGSNDYLSDYYTPQQNGSEPHRKIPSEAYAENLVAGHLFNHLDALYKAGARKIALFGLPPLGCSPAAVKMYAVNQHCVSFMDTDAHIFNSWIPKTIDTLTKSAKDARFTYINIYDITSAAVLPGFKKTDVPCCEADAEGMCFAKKSSCNTPNEYFFWDGYRPTEAANIALANAVFNASVPSQANPYNIQTLIAETKKTT